MRAGRSGVQRGACALLSLAALAGGASACSDDGGVGAEPTIDGTLPPITAGPVAATELVTGDCLSGFVIGASERIRIDSVQVVSCDVPHQLEVFAVFSLATTEFPNTEVGLYPGRQRVVDAADQGCTAQLAQLGDAGDEYGLVAVWPTEGSWVVGDRDVACAAFSADGKPFPGRTIIAG